MDEGTLASQMEGLKQALRDPKTYMLSLSYFCITGAAGWQNFAPTLTATLGKTGVVERIERREC